MKAIKAASLPDGAVWITGHEARYFVTRAGVVLSMTTGQACQTMQDRHGVFVALTSETVTRFFYVHRLVAAAFLPSPTEGQRLKHINGDTADNRADNLTWQADAAEISHAMPAKPIFSMVHKNALPVIATDGSGAEIFFATISEARKATGASLATIKRAAGNRAEYAGKRWRFASN